METIKTILKYLPWALVALALAGTTYWQYTAARDARALLAVKNTELMKANLDIGRAETKFAEQEKVHKYALKQMETKIQDEIKKRQAAIQAYTELEARYEKAKNNVKIETKIVYRDRNGNPTTQPSTEGTLQGQLFTKNTEGKFLEVTQLPLFYKDFRITITGDYIQKSLSYALHQRFRLRLVETLLPTGGFNHYAELHELDDTGKEVHTLKLDRFTVMKGKLPEEVMRWWNPKLDLGLGVGVSQKADFKWTGEVGISTSGYGATPDDLRWRFFRLGAGIVSKQAFSLSFSPVQYNLGKHLPLISNCWVFPYAAYDFGSFLTHFGMGVAVVL